MDWTKVITSINININMNKILNKFEIDTKAQPNL